MTPAAMTGPAVSMGTAADIAGRIAAIEARVQSLRIGDRSAARPATNSGQSFAAALRATLRATLDAAPGIAPDTVSDAVPNTALDTVRDIGNVATAATVTGTDVVADAKKYLGVPYVWGGTTTAGLDCSGLVQRTFADLGIDLPRVSRDQATAGTAVPSIEQARPGDLVAFGDPVNHIAIYAGDGKIIEAPEAGKDVQLVDMYRTPTAIRRIVPPTDGSDSGATAFHVLTAGSAGSAGPDDPAPVTTGRGIPPGFPDLWEPARLAKIPHAIPLAALGLTPAAPASDSSAPTGPATGDDVVAGTGAAADPGAPAQAARIAVPAAGYSADRLAAAGFSDGVARFAQDFAAAEARFDLPSGVLAAVAQAESGGSASAVSPAGARGLMQLMPATAAGLGVTDPFDPLQAIPGAAKLLAGNLDRFGSLPEALAAYNAGAGAVTQFGGIPPYPETQHYVRTVTDLMARLA